MWLDAIALLLLGVFALLGARRGGLAAGLSLLSLGVAYGAAIGFAPHFAAGSVESFGAPSWLGLPLAGTLVFLAVFLGMSLASWGLRRLERRDEGGSRSPRDRFFGALFGATRGALMVLLLAYLALWVEALRTSGTLESIPELGSSAAARLSGAVVEGGLNAAVGDETPGGRMLARLAGHPDRALADLREVMEHPAVAELREDTAFWSYVEHGAVDAAMNRRGFLALMHDSELRRRLGELGMIGADAVEEPRAFRAEAAEVLRQVGPRIRGLREDPALHELLDDPEVMAALHDGDHLALMRHPGFRAVVAHAIEQPTPEL